MTMVLFALILLLHAVASENITYQADGRCGSGFGNAPCDPLLSGACCSIDGYADQRLRSMSSQVQREKLSVTI
jgi:hypothetical protein